MRRRDGATCATAGSVALHSVLDAPRLHSRFGPRRPAGWVWSVSRGQPNLPWNPPVDSLVLHGGFAQEGASTFHMESSKKSPKKETVSVPRLAGCASARTLTHNTHIHTTPQRNLQGGDEDTPTFCGLGYGIGNPRGPVHADRRSDGDAQQGGSRHAAGPGPSVCHEAQAGEVEVFECLRAHILAIHITTGETTSEQHCSTPHGHAQPPRPRQDQLRDRISRSAERSSRATPFLTSTPSKLSRSIHTRITQSGHP
jgi:hypothetical protein